MEINPYLNLLLLFGFIGFLGGTILLLSHLLGPKKKGPDEKGRAYECGLDPIGESRQRFSVKFYRVAMLFILFDVEIVFLYPWAVLFRDSIRSGIGLFFFMEMVLFLGILVVGLLYIYGHRALEWE